MNQRAETWANKILILTLLAALISYSNLSEAQYFQLDYMREKQKKIDQQRWTLADWLAVKQQIAWMDLWLAMNTSANLFEWSFGTFAAKYDRSLQSMPNENIRKDAINAFTKFYVSIFGLEGNYSNAGKDEFSAWSLAADLRLLGTSHQSTNLTAKYGYRSFEDENSAQDFAHYYFGGELTLNIFKYVGVFGEYLHYLPEKNKNEIEISGSKWRAGLFLEVKFLRVFTNWFHEPLDFKPLSGSSETQERKGLEAGVQLFF